MPPGSFSSRNAPSHSFWVSQRGLRSGGQRGGFLLRPPSLAGTQPSSCVFTWSSLCACLCPGSLFFGRAPRQGRIRSIVLSLFYTRRGKGAQNYAPTLWGAYGLAQQHTKLFLSIFIVFCLVSYISQNLVGLMSPSLSHADINSCWIKTRTNDSILTLFL